MSDYVNWLLERHRKGTVLVDTNLLLLYFVGSFDPQEIPRFKRTRTFVTEDYATLLNFLKWFEKIVTTPNILTEVSNLSGHLPKHLRADYFQVFARGIRLLEEHYCSSANISEMEEIKWLGLTDAGILHLAQDKYLVATDDFKLSQYLEKKGIDVLNFNHIRPLNWAMPTQSR